MSNKAEQPASPAPKQSSAARIAVRFHEPAPSPSKEYDGLRAFLHDAGSAGTTVQLLPLVESVSDAKLAEMIDRARVEDPTYTPASFSAWLQVVCPEDVDPESMAAALAKSSRVESAYVMRPAPPPSPVNPSDDPRNVFQGYQDPAPVGIDARYAWQFAGGDGAGTAYVDIEYGWNFNHVDLPPGIPLIAGVGGGYVYHGTGVLGIISMVDNTVGGVGIAPAASVRTVSSSPDGIHVNTADAILVAAANMVYGDVLLIELQYLGTTGPGQYLPIETEAAVYDAIRLATALGIIVVEPAGNGSSNLDAYTASGGRVLDRTSPDFRDSGAIIVGQATSSVPHYWSGGNWGNRIDCYAWGDNIDTAWTNPAGTDNSAYTSFFGGTSGSAAIIAGATLIVQGIAQRLLGYRLAPRVLRSILPVGGTPSADSSTAPIGLMPNLHAIINSVAIAAAPDIYMRDRVGDMGNRVSGIISFSPDIIVRNAPVADPELAYGLGSGTENNANLSDSIMANTGDHYLYIRLLNRGGSVATNVSVDLYWSPSATLVTPNVWHPIGSLALPSLLNGNQLTAIGPCTWPAAQIPAAGHYCFVAIAGNAADPKPGPATFTTFDQFVDFVRNNNNVAWRNFNVHNPRQPFNPTFIVRGAFDMGRQFRFDGHGRLPEGSRAWIDVPIWFADALRPHPMAVTYDRKAGTARIPMNPYGLQRMGEARLPAKVEAICRFGVTIPKEYADRHYEFAIAQIYENVEVGRVTWLIGPDEKVKPVAEARAKK